MGTEHDALAVVGSLHHLAVGQPSQLHLHAIECLYPHGVGRAAGAGAHGKVGCLWYAAHRSFLAPRSLHAAGIDGTHACLYSRFMPKTCRCQREPLFGKAAQKLLAGSTYLEFVGEVGRCILGITACQPFSTQQGGRLVENQIGRCHLSGSGVGLCNRQMPHAPLLFAQFGAVGPLLVAVGHQFGLAIAIDIVRRKEQQHVTVGVHRERVDFEVGIPIPLGYLLLAIGMGRVGPVILGVAIVGSGIREQRRPAVVVNIIRWTPVYVALHAPDDFFELAVALVTKESQVAGIIGGECGKNVGLRVAITVEHIQAVQGVVHKQLGVGEAVAVVKLQRECACVVNQQVGEPVAIHIGTEHLARKVSHVVATVTK